MAQSSPTEVPERATSQPELRRVMGPKLLLLFIVGDILGTGIYAVIGNVANQVGGVVWLPFLIAFIVATITACSYLELVTKYPQAAGAALYTHKAFGLHFFTFLIAFAVMCSGITSASTASRAFAANFRSDDHRRTPGLDGRQPTGSRCRPHDHLGRLFHGPDRSDQLARSCGERERQHRADAGGGERLADRHLRRLLRHHPG